MRATLLVLAVVLAVGVLGLAGDGSVAWPTESVLCSREGEPGPLNVYPWPDPCCAFGTYWDCVATWDPYWGLTEMYCKINWAWCYGSDPLCPAPGYYEWIDYCLGICYY